MSGSARISPLPRDLFLLDPAVAFLNHGSFGATPRPVFDDYQAYNSADDVARLLTALTECLPREN